MPMLRREREARFSLLAVSMPAYAFAPAQREGTLVFAGDALSSRFLGQNALGAERAFNARYTLEDAYADGRCISFSLYAGRWRV